LQSGDHLALWIVPLVTQRADGTPYQVNVDRMEARYRERAERSLSEASNPFRRAALKTELAREEMARLPLGAYAKAWLEGMLVNLAAPALLSDPRVRALPKPSFYNTAGATLWERARACSWSASSPRCRFSFSKPSGLSCWRETCRGRRLSRPRCSRIFCCSTGP